MSTIYEVAARAGVSPATVSRVLNGGSVSAEKSKLVRNAVAELSFTPDRTARNLRRRHSEIIALIIPDIENPFFTTMARGIEDVAQAAGYSLVLCNTDENHEKEARYLHVAVSENMAGVILAAAGDHSDLSGLIARNKPVVAVDRGPHRYDVDAVVLDNRSGGRSATAALFDQGFRTVACITGPADVETSLQRAGGWRDAITASGCAGDMERYLRYSDYRADGGYSAMRSLLDMGDPPDAVFVANNLMGLGAVQLLSDRQRIPPAFGVAVFGELPYSVVPTGSITVVHLPSRHLGLTAANLLLERINGDDQPARTIVLRNEMRAAPELRGAVD